MRGAVNHPGRAGYKALNTYAGYAQSETAEPGSLLDSRDCASPKGNRP